MEFDRLVGLVCDFVGCDVDSVQGKRIREFIRIENRG